MNTKLKNKTGEKNSKKKVGSGNALDSRVKKNIIAVFLIMIALVMLLSLVGLAGMAGQYIDKGLGFAFGKGKFLLPLVMVVLGALYFKRMEPIRYTLASIGAVLFYVMSLGFIHIIFISMDQMIVAASNGERGGYVGLAVAYPLAKFLGRIAGVVILFGFSLIGIMLVFNATLHHVFNRIRNRFKLLRLKTEQEKAEQKQDRFVEGPKTVKEEKEEDNIKIESIKYVEGPPGGGTLAGKEPDPASSLEAGLSRGTARKNIYSGSDWTQPPTSIFKKNKERPHQGNLEENVEIIKNTLGDFGIKVAPGEYHIGPTVTQYTFKPAVGVKLSKISALQNDLTLALAAEAIRIEAPIPGKSFVGIEVPNKESSRVRMRSMLESDVFKNKPSQLSIVLGEDVSGHPVLANIENMPHLLIAGATNAGKSVCINALLSTLLFQNSPEQLQMILIDPKRVELTVFQDVPHLLCPVVVDPAKVISALRGTVMEMERRYKVFQEAGADKIQSYNEKVASGKKRKVIDEETGEERQEDLEKMPFIVIVIDELSDIMMSSHGRDAETLIVRLAQMARAVGIHLIVSTQRPSREVITGLIKSNIVPRVAFQVGSHVDSQTIIDRVGAEKLLGNGDMLFVSGETRQPRRIQGVYITKPEVKKLVDFIKRQSKNMEFDMNEELSRALDEKSGEGAEGRKGSFAGGEARSDEELYEQAKEIAIRAKKASTSMLQRRLKIGYSRAARIVDMLEENGVVGPADGSKAREILVSPAEEQVEYEDEVEDEKKREKWE